MSGREHAAVPIRRIGVASARNYVIIDRFDLKVFIVEGGAP